jgi:hypothetical protein
MAVHVHPQNDERQHQLDTVGECWCDPRVEWLDPDTGQVWAKSAPRVIHNAADCREYAEELDGKAMAPDKRWHITIVE